MPSRPRPTPTPIQPTTFTATRRSVWWSAPVRALEAPARSCGPRRHATGGHAGRHRHRQLRHGDRAQHRSCARLIAPGAPRPCCRAGTAGRPWPGTVDNPDGAIRRGRRRDGRAARGRPRCLRHSSGWCASAASRYRSPARATTRIRPAQLARQMARPENEAMRRSNRRAVADADLLDFATAVLTAS